MFKRVSMLLAIILLIALPVSVFAENAGRSGQVPDRLSESIAEEYTGGAKPPERYLEPSVQAEFKIFTHAGTPTQFQMLVFEGTAPVVRYAWDFESDGVLDYESATSQSADWRYTAPGSYIATGFAFDAYGKFGRVEVPVTVESGQGEVRFAPLQDPLTFWGLEEKRRNASRQALDDPATRYFLFMCDGEDRFWYTVRNAHVNLQDSMGYDDSLIVVVASHHPTLGYNYYYDSYLPDTVIIDYSTLDSALNFLMARMTENDELHVMHCGHGSGKFDSSTVVYGDGWTPYSLNISIFPAMNVANGDKDLDQLESEYPAAWNYHSGNTGYVGLNAWAAIRSGSTCYRMKKVIQFTGMTFYNSTVTLDRDIYVEDIRQHFKGDTDRDCVLDATEVWDYDGDGNPPCSLIAGTWVFDEQDWGVYQLYYNYNATPAGRVSINGPFRFTGCFTFDKNFDGIIDFDYACTDSLNPTIDGSDFNNDGLLIGLDINGDGDKLDSVGVDENSFGSKYDDYIDQFLDSLDYARVTFILQGCFSGGFIDDLSRDNVLISTATTAGTVAWGDLFSDEMAQALIGYSSKNLNGDNKVTFLEAFNSINGMSDDRERLDDNADAIGHVYDLVNGGDGYAADSLNWGTLPPPAPVPVLVSPAGDTLNSPLPTFIWSDTAAADSFRVSVSGMGWVSGPWITTDTVFTVPDGEHCSILTGTVLDYEWTVEAFEGLAKSRPADATATFSLVADYTCCVGMRGNVDGDSSDLVDIADLTRMIEFLNYPHAPLGCWPEGNVDGYANELPTSTDLQYLINYLFNGGPAPVSCP